MATIEYGGRSWTFREAAPVDALRVVQASGPSDYWEMLLDALVPSEAAVLGEAISAGALPGEAVSDMVQEWLETSTGLPISAVGSLSGTVVNQWPVIRGRLVRSGIPDPLTQVRTLGALLSVVWDMLLEGCKDEKAQNALRAKVFRPTVKRRTAATYKPKTVVTDKDLAEQNAMLMAMMDED